MRRQHELDRQLEQVCSLTYFCDGTFNIHMETPGYHIIAALEAKTLPKLK